VLETDEDEQPDGEAPAAGTLAGFLLGDGIAMARRIAIRSEAGAVSTRAFGEKWQVRGTIEKG
jgi:hypothetical protein